MPRIQPLKEKEYSSEVKITFVQHKTIYNTRITNTKATLGHSPTAFKAYMEWYPLFEEVKRFLGARLATLYVWSISEATGSQLSSTQFRKAIIDSGEDPETLIISEKDRQLLNYGVAIAKNNGYVSNEIIDPIRRRYDDEQFVAITALTGITIATNIFNNVVGTEIDEYLQPFTVEKVV